MEIIPLFKIFQPLLIQKLLTDFIQQSCLQNNKKQNNRISKKPQMLITYCAYKI